MVSNKIKEELEEIRYCPMCKKRERRKRMLIWTTNVDAVTVSTPDSTMDEAKNDPCWDGYKQVGMKKKGEKNGS